MNGSSSGDGRPVPEAPLPGPRAVAPESGTASRFARWLRSVPPWGYALALYGLSAVVVFRAGLYSGPYSFPQGTNALNNLEFYWWIGQHPTGTWLFPFTDWGQPFPGYTGPTLLYPAVLALPPAMVVRGLEAISWVGAGLAMYWLSRGLGAAPIASIASGFYYANVVQTPQLFEGHVPTMVGVAVLPVFFWCFGRFVRSPTPWTGAGTAFWLYVLGTVGDLGTLYLALFFAIPLAAYLLLRRQLVRRYTIREVGLVVAAAASVLLLALPWLYPYVLGARPQFTTTITSNTVSFSAVAGQNLGYSFLGYVQESSFIHYTYHQSFFSLYGSQTLWVYLVVPLLVLASLVVTWSWHRLVLYLTGVLTLLFSGGALYPWLSPFNRWFWTHIPFFNTNPALTRWTNWTVFVYAILLGLVLSAVETGSGWRRPHPRRWWRAALARVRREPVPARSGPARPTRWRLPTGRPELRRGVAVGIVVAVGVSTVVQTWIVDARPPGFFDFPSAYTEGFSYIASHPVTGEILTVPYGTIYERTPWGGLSESAFYMGPYYTGADTLLFEAGTPPSLALDTFLQESVNGGSTRNLSKLLPGLNVQYLLATDYPNWKYANAVAGNPAQSYAALANQTGIAPAVFSGGYQTVYPVPETAGNLSFWPSYLVYVGGTGVVAPILDSDWYPGHGVPLVDGDQLGDALSTYVAHAAAVVLPAREVASRAPLLELAHQEGTPVVVVGTAFDMLQVGGVVTPNPWNASDGADLYFSGSAGEVGLSNSTLGALGRAGFTSAQLTTQLSCPAEGGITILSGPTPSPRTIGPPVTRITPLPWSSPGYASAGETNPTEGYPGSVSLYAVNGTPYLRWTLQPDSTEFQYVSLPIHNLSGFSGIAVQFEGAPPPFLVAQVVVHGVPTPLSGYESIVPIGRIPPTWYFTLPRGVSPSMSRFVASTSNVSEVRIGLPGPIWQDNFTFSNLSLFSAPAPGFRTVDLGAIPIGANTSYRLALNAPCSVNLLTAVASPSGPVHVATSADRFSEAVSNPADLAVAARSDGWGLFVLAQTYSPLWQASFPGSSPSHATVDVGLNAWLTDAHAGGVFHVWYPGDVWERQSLVLESASLGGGAALLIAAVIYRRRRKARAVTGGATP